MSPSNDTLPSNRLPPPVGSSPGQRSRSPFADAIKGIAILGVLFFHGVACVAAPSADSFALSMTGGIGRTSVPLFFGVFAWATTRTSRGLKGILEDAARRLLLPFIAWSVIYAFSEDVIPTTPCPGGPIVGIFLGCTEAHLWFMVPCLLLIPCRPMLAWLAKRRSWLVDAGLVLAALAHVVWLGVLDAGFEQGSPARWMTYGYSWLPTWWLAPIAAGLLAGRHERRFWSALQRLSSPHRVAIGSLALGLTVLTVASYATDHYNLYVYAVPGVYPASATMLLLAATALPPVPAVQRFLAWLGKRSFPLYLSHLFFFGFAWRAFYREDASLGAVGSSLLVAACASTVYAGFHERVFGLAPRAPAT